ncbi:MAG: acyl carrier protein [Gammaproteobacteria bacterium]|nr:acyl carrier protein [Gammaproteobacteria bacterium]
MNDDLKIFLQKVFNLTESEFSETLTRDDISDWDSLKHMDLITGLEREFNIQLEMQDILAMQSIPIIVDTLEKYDVSIEK